MKLLIAPFAAAAILVSSSVRAQEGKPVTITVGAVEVTVPLPVGFQRLDGINAEFDRVQQSFFPPTNMLKLNLGSSEDRAAIEAGSAPEMVRTMNIQVMRDVQDKNISQKDFNELRKLMRKQMASMDVNSELKKTTERGSKELSNSLGEDVKVDIKTVGEIGVLEEDDNHITFGTELSLGVSAAGEQSSEKGYGVGSLVRLHGKVINLYCNVSSNSGAEKAWARDTLKAWRNAILASNADLASTMASVPESNLGRKKPFSGILKAALIGAVIGGVIALFGALKKKA